jgi:hypothetical protein
VYISVLTGRRFLRTNKKIDGWYRSDKMSLKQ